jgi:uncharacterized protein YdiU (UPF0061 family)
MFYDGNPEPEPGAIVCRVAPSFVRFGNFQILTARDEPDNLKRLADYVIREHFPELVAGGRDSQAAPGADTYVRWFHEICRRTASLMADWMRVGFVHGVMNTDNMSILGLTIDYGPYGWLEGYDLAWTPNTTDAQGRRYSYGNQPHIADWNLARLAEALLPLIPEADLVEGLSVYAETFRAAWQRALAQKLGVVSLDQEGDDRLVADLFELLAQVETDFTLFFRNLAAVPLDAASDDAALTAPLSAAYYENQAFEPEQLTRTAVWLRSYAARVRRDGLAVSSRLERMNGANPKYVFRNYLAQQAIDALAQGDASVLERLMNVLRRPYDEQPQHEDLAGRRPEWARHKAGCSALSCSS